MGRLVIENENLAAWMTINNTFAIKHGRRSRSTPPDPAAWNKEESYWVGVMIQLGRFRSFEDQELMHGFDAIVLDNGTRNTITSADFEKELIWIDIAPETPLSGRAFPTKHGSRPAEDDNVRDLWFVETPSLHGYLKPYDGGITLWTENGFSVLVEPQGVHRKFTFVWEEPTQATLYRKAGDNPKPSVEVIHRLLTLEIKQNHAAQSGIHQDPPQRP